uniref:FAF domain-containing protein n=1 Tax=Fagus sylvatica TaxID=28930 RepID=A0A2N9EAQ2_FAGSY
MSTPLSRSLRVSSYSNIIDEETKIMEKQGIVSILGSDCERITKAGSSLRRTLSADMSSKKWLAQNGFSPMMKKIASSKELSLSLADSLSSSSSEGEEDYEERKERSQLDIWSSIQEEKKKKGEVEKPAGQFDIWSSILSQKANEDGSKPLPPPYIHPLVKRSASCLTKKSLEICTESLGSETGSDGFSSYPPSETGDVEEDKEEEEEEEVEEEQQQLQEQEQEQQQQLQEEKVSPGFEEEFRVAKYHYAGSKKSQPRSFPPPLPSLRQDGASLRMESRRDNGRLVLEAVSIPSQNQFRAQRQDGRLVLTFVNTPASKEEEEEKNKADEFEELGDFEEDDQDQQEEEEEGEEEYEEDDEGIDEDNENIGTKEIDIVMEQGAEFSGSRVMNVHRLALMMNKPIIGIANRNNQAWARKINEVVKFEEDDDVDVDVKPTQVAKSLPPRPRVARLIPTPQTVSSTAAPASLNAYEYYWRAKPIAKTALKNKLTMSNQDSMSNEHQQFLVQRGNKGDCLPPMLKGCKEPRRSLFWEPYCIATS